MNLVERSSDADQYDLLREPPRSYRQQAGLLAGAGVAGWGLLPIVGYPGWDVPALAGGAVLGATTFIQGRRSWERQRVRDSLATTLAPLIGGPSRKMVKVGYSGREISTITLSYVAHQADYDPKWRARLTEAVSARLGEQFVIESIDGPRRRILLVPTRLKPGAVDERPREQRRLEDAVLKLLGETGSIAGVAFDEEGHLVALDAAHEDPTRFAQPAIRRAIESRVTTIQPERWRAKWDLSGDVVRFERRPSLPTSLWIPQDSPEVGEDLLADYGRVRFRVGMDEDQNIVEWAPAILPQVLISGGTGTGKTSTMHALLAEVTRHGWPVWIADGKQIEFLAFRDWPNVQMVATSIQEQVAVIDAAERVMNERYTLIKSGRAKISDFEPLVVVIDELAELVQNLLAWYPDVKSGKANKPPTLKQIGSLLRLARTARIHLVVAMQRPDVALLGGGGAGGGEARSNFGFRMSVGRLDPQGAVMMWQNAATGVAIPRSMRQRGMVTGHEGQPVEAQFFRFPDMDAADGTPERALIDSVRPTERRHPRLVIEVPRPTLDPETGVEIIPTFDDYVSAAWHYADERPDLDPLHRGSEEPVDGRVAASPVAVLRVGQQRIPGESEAEEGARAHRHLHAVGGTSADVGPDLGEVELDEFAGYAEPEQVAGAYELNPGDLIELEDGSWGVVEEEPSPDPDDPGLALIAWRSNVGVDDGTEAVPEDEPFMVRKPIPVDEGESILGDLT